MRIQDESNPTKVDRARSTSKQMIACFFRKIGHVAIVPLEQRRTVNSEWHTTICLPVIFEAIRKTNRRRRITLHHNASSHTSAQTTAFLSTQNIDLMNHMPYSLDLGPNDFFLLRSECMFWRCLNQSDKSASTIGSNASKIV